MAVLSPYTSPSTKYFIEDKNDSLKLSLQALAGYGVPTPTPHPDHHHDHHGGGGTLKTGYFPPNNRVMPRVSRK